LEKARQAREIIDRSGRDIRLEIDGGVNAENIGEIAAAGVDTFVSGSALFGKGQDSDPNGYDSIVKAMRDELAKVK
ncbi:MAG: ribulose-phosphate 3-epimerase, partial [Halothiobacillaceae bacterium]|nr:ribulose-phosphate 3-epimerase [Halothiobacillaceae bacterium]